MKKSVKLLFFCLMFLIFPIMVDASDVEITSLETSIELGKNRVANITENYELYYIENTKVFNRTIDTSLNLIRKNEAKSVIKPVLSNINIKNDYIVNNSDKTKTLSLSLKGIKDTKDNFELKYQYDLGKDTSSKNDEFYYNIVSNFDAVVSDVSFEIILPTNVIKKKDISFVLNEKVLNNNYVSFDIENNIITGYLNKMLDENDTFAIRIEFPDGYFVGTSDNFNYLKYLILIVPILGFCLVIIYWFKYAKGNRMKKQFSYYPPNNFDPAEIGYLYKGKTEESDITTTLLYLANKGYLKIEENDDGYKLGKENSFNLIKEKRYKGRNAIQKIIFEGVFKDREKSELNDIEYTIKNNLMDAKDIIDNIDNRKKIFNIDINKSKRNILIMVIISIILLTINPVKEFTGSYILVPVLSLTMLFGLAVIAIINTSLIPKIIISLIFSGGSIFLNIYSLLGQTNNLYIYLIGIILVILTTLIFSKLPSRTKYGNETLGLVEGFRIELATMTEKKLQEILEENPNYYYEMIPYILVFDLTDNWLNVGKRIITDRPNWHITTEKYELKKEIKFFKNFIFVTTQVMIKGLYMQKESQQLEFKKDVPVIKAREN